MGRGWEGLVVSMGVGIHGQRGTHTTPHTHTYREREREREFQIYQKTNINCIAYFN
jgi:hypothetical protein